MQGKLILKLINHPAMKHNHNHANAPGAGLQLVPVRFEFTHPAAVTVCIAGTFNQWHPKLRLCIPQKAVASGKVDFGKDMQQARKEIQNCHLLPSSRELTPKSDFGW
jgi:hypothetical protein